MFGSPVGLHFNGSQTYQTWQGGLLSCFVVILIGYFAVLKLDSLKFSSIWIANGLVSQADNVSDLAPVNFGDLKNLSVALEFEYPYMGVPTQDGNSFQRRTYSYKKQHYNQIVKDLNKFLYVEQYHFTQSGLNQT